MADEIAGWAVTVPERLRYPLMAAFRQALEAGVRYGYLTRNPAKLAGANPMPAPREIRVYTAGELERITAELDQVAAAAVAFAAATGLRPSEWASVERETSTGLAASIHARDENGPLAARGPSNARGAGRARTGTAAARQPVCVYDLAEVPGDRRAGSVRRRELPSSRVGTCDRRLGDRYPGEALRPTVDVRLECARGGDHDVRARPSHGDEREDDRATLRHADRHGTRRDSVAARGRQVRLWDTVGPRRRRVMPGTGLNAKRMKGLEPSTFCMARTGRELTASDHS
jgi:hypothetical protein